MEKICAPCAGTGEVMVDFSNYEGKRRTEKLRCGACHGEPLRLRTIIAEGECQACGGKGVRRPYFMAETCSGPRVPVLGPEEPCAACAGTGKCPHCVTAPAPPDPALPLVADDDGVWAAIDLCPYCCF